MRTRRSPRNQELLFKALFKAPDSPITPATTHYCGDCVSFPNWRMRGECTLMGKIVNSANRDRECFKLRSQPFPGHKKEIKII